MSPGRCAVEPAGVAPPRALVARGRSAPALRWPSSVQSGSSATDRPIRPSSSGPTRARGVGPCQAGAMRVHLVDGTYELFRHFFGAPPRTASDGTEVGAARGVVSSVLAMLEG